MTGNGGSWRLLVAVCAVTLLCTIGVAMPYPILAPIFVDGPADGFTHFAGMPPEWLLGVALAANPAGILLGSLVLGPLSDRLGRRRVLMATLLACALGYLLTAAALQARLYLLFVAARFAVGLTEGNIAVARALLADHYAEAMRVKAFAWLNAFQYGGWLLGPLIGGLLLRWGEAVPFALAAGAMLPCLGLVMIGVPAGAPPHAKAAAGAEERHRPMTGSTLAPLMHDPALQRLFALQMAYMCGVTALYEYAPLWCVTEAGIGPAGIAWITAVQCAAMVAGTALASRLPALDHPLRTTALAALAGAAGLALLVVVPATPGLVTIVALGVPLAVYNAFMPAWVSSRFARHGQGRVMGLLTTIFCFANVLVALAGGLLSLWSVRGVMALGALCAGTAGWALWHWARREAAADGAAVATEPALTR
ncbi:MFS transporter [Ideonella sp.]|uniref:MFS transporter n=1 Tax=Ideonella sp. TaxID=1929293 RepID=UPI002B45A840|nr:MFS transporter [Ideonella sp.]HJV70018.1 MFS transporter [Ideonella sp.]